MNIDLTGKTAVVTGGSSGIGLETARLFLQAGANVAICGRDTDRLATAYDDLGADGARLMSFQCDVLNKDQVAAFAKAVDEKFGGVDILINNAGQARVATFAQASDDDWREEFELKLFSVIHPTRAFLPLLEKSDVASIVCSNALLARQPEPHLVLTSSARAAILNMLHSLAGEFAPKGIRVNSILIGIIESGQLHRRHKSQAKEGESFDDWSNGLAKEREIPLGRVGLSEEAARAIFFLGSPMSSYTTGTTIDVTGGLNRNV
jgi:NAD(P)-dependent dehydrogenase (short-subunit alcohol dehydrogenase family)